MSSSTRTTVDIVIIVALLLLLFLCVIRHRVYACEYSTFDSLCIELSLDKMHIRRTRNATITMRNPLNFCCSPACNVVRSICEIFLMHHQHFDVVHIFTYIHNRSSNTTMRINLPKKIPTRNEEVCILYVRHTYVRIMREVKLHSFV